MFFAMGGLVLAALDQVPSGLHDNAIILGVLSFIVGFLFLYDLSDPLRSTTSEMTQTIPEQPRELLQIETKLPTQTIGIPAPLSIEERLMIDEGRLSPQNVEIVKKNILPIRQTPRVIDESDIIKIHRPKSNPNLQQTTPKQPQWKEEFRPKSVHYEMQEAYRDNRGFIEDHTRGRSGSSGGFQPRSSYMKGSVVDQGNFILKKNEICCNHRSRNHLRDDGPMTPGFVANTARLWERRTRSTSSNDILGLQTNV